MRIQARAPGHGAHALLIVPPLLKYLAGPTLGPALLKSAGEARGHHVDLLDLNLRYLLRRFPGGGLAQADWVGDHDRPDLLSRQVEPLFVAELAVAGRLPAGPPGEVSHLAMTGSFDEVDALAMSLAEGPLGQEIRAALAAYEKPDLVGVSVLFSSQVAWSLAISIVARNLWPNVPVVWGGAHVTALQARIGAEARYGRFVDGFVAGNAECTFGELLDAVAAGRPWPAACGRAGQGPFPRAAEEISTAPAFAGLGEYPGPRLTLPAQTSRGCAYGRCGFCTYPAVEGGYRDCPLELAARPVLNLAGRLEAAVSFKDSLLLPGRLANLADMARGRVRWSATTKLHSALAGPLMERLAASGLDTLEFGLETLSPDGQELIGKRQSLALFEQVLASCSRNGVGVVVNYLIGLPGADPVQEGAWLDWLRRELPTRPGRIKLSLSQFQLEHLAPLARSPQIRVTGSWPWASVLDWELAIPAGDHGPPQDHLPAGVFR